MKNEVLLMEVIKDSGIYDSFFSKIKESLKEKKITNFEFEEVEKKFKEQIPKIVKTELKWDFSDEELQQIQIILRAPVIGSVMRRLISSCLKAGMVNIAVVELSIDENIPTQKSKWEA